MCVGEPLVCTPDLKTGKTLFLSDHTHLSWACQERSLGYKVVNRVKIKESRWHINLGRTGRAWNGAWTCEIAVRGPPHRKTVRGEAWEEGRFIYNQASTNRGWNFLKFCVFIPDRLKEHSHSICKHSKAIWGLFISRLKSSNGKKKQQIDCVYLCISILKSNHVFFLKWKISLLPYIL